MAPDGEPDESDEQDYCEWVEYQKEMAESWYEGSRRQFVTAAGAGLLAGLAGCGGQGGEATPTEAAGTPTPTPTEGDETPAEDEATPTPTEAAEGEATPTETETETETATPVQQRLDASWNATMWQTADKFQFNPWNGSNRIGTIEGQIFDTLGTFNEITREWNNVLAKEVNYRAADEILEITLRDATWSPDGQEITAEDVVIHQKLERFVTAKETPLKENGEVKSDSGFWQYGRGIEAADDKTVHFLIDGKVNSSLLLAQIMGMQVRTPRFIYGKWVDRFSNAVPEGLEAYNQVRSKFTQWDQKKAVGSSAWQLDEAVPQRATYKIWEGNPFADNINFTTYKTFAAETNKEHWALFKSGKTNGLGAAAPEHVIKSFPDSMIHVKRLIPNYFGSGMMINFDDKIMGRRNVRKALAYAVDARRPAQTAGPYQPIVDNFSGIGGGVAGVPQNILGDVANKLVDYDLTKGTGGKDWNLATQHLEKEGFSKQKDTWITPNGKTFKLPLKVVTAHSDMVRQFKVLSGQLNEFGIEASLASTEGATYWDMLGRGDFKVAEGFWVSRYPYHSFNGYWGYDGESHWCCGYPHKVKNVPKPFDPEAEERVTIDCHQILENLAVEPDPEKQKQMLRQLAWAFNQDLPIIPIEERMLGLLYNPVSDGGTFEVPRLEDANGALSGKPTGKGPLAVQFAQGGFVRRGLTQAKST